MPLNGATVLTSKSKFLIYTTVEERVSYQEIDNALSISTLVSTYADLPTKCHFDYVDFQAALVLIRPNTWAVGPPQTIRSVSCRA